MNNYEARIRDFLAENLGLLERGMVLVGKEYSLGSDLGAGGYIDLLAKDRLGHFVVIEIKRSNQAARAALHELTKYTALLKSSLGIPPERIRALLLSTEWHELAVPFSEYLKAVEVPTEGYVLVADESGTVSSVTPFSPVRLDAPLKVERSQLAWLFATPEGRNESVSEIARAATRSGVNDFLILSVDYGGGDERVIYPHAAYFAFSSPLAGMDEAQSKAFIGDREWFEELDDPLDNIVGWVVDNARVARDDVEIGYPEKFLRMQRSGWNATVAHRNGKYEASFPMITDDALIAEISRVEGGASYYLTKSASPQYLPSWNAFKNDIDRTLFGASFWQRKVRELLEEIEHEQPKSTVYLHAYNQPDLVRTVATVANNGDESFTPRFEFVVHGPDKISHYMGELSWDGTPVSISAQTFLKRLFGDPFKYFVVGLTHEHHQFFDTACELLNIECLILVVDQPGSTEQESTLYACPERHRKSRTVRPRPLTEFANNNRGFCNELIAFLVGNSQGFFPTDQA